MTISDWIDQRRTTPDKLEDIETRAAIGAALNWLSGMDLAFAAKAAGVQVQPRFRRPMVSHDAGEPHASTNKPINQE